MGASRCRSRRAKGGESDVAHDFGLPAQDPFEIDDPLVELGAFETRRSPRKDFHARKALVFEQNLDDLRADEAGGPNDECREVCRLHAFQF